MKRVVIHVACAVALCLGATESLAQGLAPSVYFTYGSTQFAASDSFDAITGSSSKSGFGVGGRVDGLWHGLFADVGFSQRKLDGQRVFVSGSTVFPLGVATEITYRPIDLAAGWRFNVGRVRPYVGAGSSITTYRETADFAEPGDEVDERKTGALLLAGVDVGILRYVRVGGEFRYRSIGGVLGDGGVSRVFGDDELGGLAFAARISVGR